MKITIFQSITKTDTPHYKTPLSIIERIRSEKDIDLVHAIRGEHDKEKRNAIKRKLPAICWSGTFTHRADNAIKDHSGLICLDFDNYDCEEDMTLDKETFCASPFVYCCFVSPSGYGLKVVVKIPNVTANHRSHFKALQLYIDNPHFDDKCINESRVCYSSCDPDIYVNEDSRIFMDLYDDVEIGNKDKPILFENDEQLIVDNLIKWWSDKFDMNEGGRNNNLHVLASALNRYGVGRSLADNVCRIQANGLPGSEIDKLVHSAYKRTSEFSTQFFEAKTATAKIKRMTTQGFKTETIAAAIAQDNSISQERATEAVEIEQEKNKTHIFWEPTKTGLKILSYEYKQYLTHLGFYKYYAVDSQSFIFVCKKESKIFDTSEEIIKDTVLNDQFSKGHNEVWNHLASRPKYFKEDFLSMLDNCGADFVEDDQNTAYLYFDNTSVKVTKNEVQEIGYNDLGSSVWGKHCLEREFKPSSNIENDFKKFIWNVSAKDDSKRRTFESVIGFLLHSYKTGANNKAIILNDELISDNPNGGTGKGIFNSSIAHMKRVATIDGKNFSSDKSFAYQLVQVDTQILCLDDIKKNFNFEALFSLITEGMTLEKKNKDAIKLPIQKSPKLLISTNYAVKGEGNSFERRKFELEFAQYYNATLTPETEFGRMMFYHWNADDWVRFDNYMISCLQLYLNEGLIPVRFNNLKTKKFISDTSSEFFEWMTDTDNKERNFEFDERNFKKPKYEQFLEDYPDYAQGKNKLSARRFNQWVESYARHIGLEYVTGSSNGQRWHAIVKDGIKTRDQRKAEQEEAIDMKPNF